MAAIIDATSKGSNGGGASSLSWNHIIGAGDNRILIVNIEGEYNTGTPSVSSVTFNGVALTKIDAVIGGGGSHSVDVEMWALWGANVPAAGTYPIVITWNSNVNLSQAGGAMSFFNVKPQTAEAFSSAATAGTSPLSDSVITLTNNALLVTAYGSQNTPGASSTTGDTLAFNSVPATGEQSESDGFYRTVVTPISSTVSLTVSNPESQVMIVASFETLTPVVSGAGASALFL